MGRFFRKNDIRTPKAYVFQMERDAVLELQRRREIYEFVAQNNGVHLRDIARQMNLPVTSLRYHLAFLEKRGLILFRQDGKYTRYFVTQEVSEQEKKILTCLRRKPTLHILLCFLIAVQCSQKDLSRFLEKHPATISFHLKHMLQAGIIEQVPIDEGVVHTKTQPSIVRRPQVSSEKVYVLTDHGMIYDLLLKHRHNLGDDALVTGIIEYVEFYNVDGVPRQIQGRDQTLESVKNVFLRFVFPPSFSS